MLEADTTTRRERRIAARRAQLLDAAAHVFSHKGYEKATTKEIAEVADVSEGTLFNYFATKRELLIGVAKAYADEVAADIASVQGETFEDMLSQLMANRFRRGRGAPPVYALSLRSPPERRRARILRARSAAPHYRRHRAAADGADRFWRHAPGRSSHRRPHDERHHYGALLPCSSWAFPLAPVPRKSWGRM
jgi:AcrR family transcriptional regulator